MIGTKTARVFLMLTIVCLTSCLFPSTVEAAPPGTFSGTFSGTFR